MKSTLQTVFFSVGLAALGAVAACSSSSSGSGGTGDDGGGQDATGGSSGGTSSSGSSGASSSSGAASSSGASSSGASSSSSGAASSGGSSSGSSDGGSSSGASSSGGSSSGGSSTGGSSGGDAGTTMLTVDNFDSWCTITINGGTPFSTSGQTVSVPTGSTVQLVATAKNSTFELGPTPWHKTAGDTGSGDPGTVNGTGVTATSSTTVVAAGATQCVYACCPFTNGTGCSGAGFTAPCN